MNVDRYAPSAALADIVGTYWIGSWDLRGQEPHTTHLIADPCVNLAFEEGGVHAGSRIVGVWTRLWRRTLAERGRVIGVKLRAGAVRAVFDGAAVELSDRITPLEERYADAPALTARVLGAADPAEVVGHVEAWLLAQRRQEDVSLPVAVAARVAADRTVVTVERLAEVAGVGPRGLQRLFRDHVGASPKRVIRWHRLQEVAARLEGGEPTSLAELAFELGYADHAHLARDFRHAVGKPPSAFAAERR